MINTIEKIEQDSLAQKLYIKNEGIREGKIIGLEEGIQEGIKKIAINMLKADMPIKQITTVTGLTEEEISELEQQLEN